MHENKKRLIINWIIIDDKIDTDLQIDSACKILLYRLAGIRFY